MCPSFIQSPIARGVVTATDDKSGGPLAEEILAGTGILVTEVDVGGGNKKLRIALSGASGGDVHSDTVDPTANNDSADTAGIGVVFELGDSWVNQTSNKIYRAVDVSVGAAIWKDVTNQPDLETETITDDATTNVVVAEYASVKGVLVEYTLSAATSRRTGLLYVTHNGTTAEVRDEYVLLGTSFDVEVTADISGSDLRINLTASSVGSNPTFYYTVRSF